MRTYFSEALSAIEEARCAWARVQRLIYDKDEAGDSYSTVYKQACSPRDQQAQNESGDIVVTSGTAHDLLCNP
jgi:hypothetical protein